MSKRVAVAAVGMAVLLAAVGASVQSHWAVGAAASRAAASIAQLQKSGVDSGTVNRLTLRLWTIEGERWGPLEKAWLPEPLTGQQGRLQGLAAEIGRVRDQSLTAARRDAQTALQQLLAADPGLPSAEQSDYRARIERAATPSELGRLATALRAAAGTAATQRQPVLDLAPKVATLRQLTATASGMGIDTGQSAAAVAAYEALTKMPAREVADRPAAVGGMLDRAIEALSTSIKAAKAPAPAPQPTQRGRVVVIDLSDQYLYAYQDGGLYLSTPVTTGRPELPTGQGTFQVIFKRSPYQFISPWPPSSPYYYSPAWTNWAVEFIGDGTFLHDAPWQPDGTYGPGSEQGPYASHGCVHVPKAVMPTLYSWLQVGDTVIVQP